MNRWSWYILFLLLLTLIVRANAQQKFMARVVDADTGEPMPCVGIYVSQGRTTITNFDGDFQIEAMPDDTLRLTCMGYNTMRIKASQLPPIVEMRLAEGRLAEVSVIAGGRIVADIAQKADKAFRKAKKERGCYFFRQTSVFDQQQEIAEAFVDARTAMNLRDVHILSGRHGLYSQWQLEQSALGQTNFHHVLELAPMMFDSPFWKQLSTPLQTGRSIGEQRQMYDISVEDVEVDGRAVYRIGIARAEGNGEERPVMTGTLYADRTTLDPLSFEGTIENVRLNYHTTSTMGLSGIPLTVHFHIEYDLEEGFPKVASLGMQANWEKLVMRSLLFNIDRQGGIATKESGTPVGENMIAAIDQAGFEPALWDNREVVVRTKQEEQIARNIAQWGSRRVGIEPTDTLSALNKLADRVRRFGERIPQEKVYLHLDNTCYFLGDTIWFAAYTRRTDTGRPSRVSRVLYTELWNHDGYLVERKLVEMREGRGSGFFALPDTLYSGFFELRAYTRWQLNWGQREHPHNKQTELQFYNEEMARDYFRDYDKLYSRVFPVYDRPEEEGEFVRSMTLRPMRRDYSKASGRSKPLLTLYPEGGNLVGGLPCRVAFEAAMEDGEALEGTVVLRDKQGDVKLRDAQGNEATEARTENRGRGSFIFIPEKGKTYQAVFTTEDGRKASADLKDIEADGVALQVGTKDSTWTFDVRSTLPKTLGMTIMHEGVTQRFVTGSAAGLAQESLSTSPVEGEGDSHAFAFSMPQSQLPTGINQVTVFDEDGRIWADRLFFVSRPELTSPTIAIAGVKDRYGPYEQVNLDVRCKMENGNSQSSILNPQSSISLSVRDAVRQDNTFDSGNILTEMLLASEVRGFIPHPEWFFERDDEEHRRALDLLMMTQGWRRFSWRDMAVEGEWEITHPAEQSQVVEGSVNPYLTDMLYEEHYEDSFHVILKKSSYLELLNRRPVNQKDSVGPNPWKDIKKLPDGSTIDKFKGFRAVLEAQEKFVPRRLDNHAFAESRFEYMRSMKLKRDVRVHSEFIQPDGSQENVVGDVTTREGRFRVELPRFYGDCLFFLTAKDTTLWDKKMRKLWNKRYRQHIWVQPEDDENQRLHEDAEFYVRLNFPYPRWVKPYDYYQTRTDSLRFLPVYEGVGDDVRMLEEVTARAHWNGLRRLDLSKPVLVVDAYEAANAAMDAGLLSDLYALKEAPNVAAELSFAALGYQNMGEVANACILNYFGDMNMDRRYQTALLWDSIRVAGDGIKEAAFVAKETQRQYSRLDHIDKVYLYSDYSPRWEGDRRYSQDNQPTVEISLHKLPENQRRLTYRDRRYVLHGFAYQADFYHPDYKRNPPRDGQKDYRRTLYWNPNLLLDEEGKARVTFFSGSRPAQIQVEAEGMDGEGRCLWSGSALSP